MVPPNRLRELREKAGLKVYDLAHRYRVQSTTVWRWEGSLTAIPDNIKIEIAKDFSVSVSYLMYDWDPTEPARTEAEAEAKAKPKGRSRAKTEPKASPKPDLKAVAS
jgi:transcriptional regulator with XRE-family HTH domain